MRQRPDLVCGPVAAQLLGNCDGRKTRVLVQGLDVLHALALQTDTQRRELTKKDVRPSTGSVYVTSFR